MTEFRGASFIPLGVDHAWIAERGYPQRRGYHIGAQLGLLMGKKAAITNKSCYLASTVCRLKTTTITQLLIQMYAATGIGA
ncbi:hypothetical protein TNCV_4365321 [Trichonephila clavipes]|nr:hypothetical protein TNCV_4365321 [Trichonephila clavipes]